MDSAPSVPVIPNVNDTAQDPACKVFTAAVPPPTGAADSGAEGHKPDDKDVPATGAASPPPPGWACDSEHHRCAPVALIEKPADAEKWGLNISAEYLALLIGYRYPDNRKWHYVAADRKEMLSEVTRTYRIPGSMHIRCDMH